jgi:hypothetical protein
MVEVVTKLYVHVVFPCGVCGIAIHLALSLKVEL